MGLSSDYPKTVTQQGGGWTGSQAGPLVGLGEEVKHVTVWEKDF